MTAPAWDDEAAQNGLKQKVGLTGVVMFGAGTAIGVSIFTVLQPAASVAGSGLLAAVVLAGLPMILFAAVYAYLSSILPLSGASFEWPSRFVHPLAGFLIAWLRILGSAGAVCVLARVLVSYLHMAGFGWPSWLSDDGAMAAIILFIFAINLLGVSVAARLQSAMMAILLVALAIFVGAGLPIVSMSHVLPLSGGDWMGVAIAVPLMISLFLGIESATEIGEEVRDARRNIPRGIALAIALTATVYLLVSFVALGLVGPAALAASQVPLLEAARVALGPSAAMLIVLAATVSILKTINAIVLVFSRYLFAMGRAAVLPSVLGHLNPRRGTPDVALGVAMLACLSLLVMPSSLVFLLLAVNIPTMLKYGASCLAARNLVRRHPDLHDRSRLGWSRRTMECVAWAGMACAAAIVLIGLGADWRPYLLVAGWALLGLFYWHLKRYVGRGSRPAHSPRA